MYIGQDSDQKHLFSHTNSNSCDTFKRVAAQAVARYEGVLSNKSGLHTAPLVLQTASARPEAVCFELRHFCRRESVKTNSKKSGLHTAPLVLETASARPEAVYFELRHFCRRESVKTNSNAKWLASSDVRSTYSEDGAVLLDIRKGLCYSLNPVAAQIWVTIESSQSGID